MVNILKILLLMFGFFLSYVALGILIFNLFSVQLPLMEISSKTMFWLLYVIFPVISICLFMISKEQKYVKVVALFFLFLWINAIFWIIYIQFQN